MFNRIGNELRKTASVLGNAVREQRYRSVVFAGASRREGTTTMALNTSRLLQSREGLRPLVVEVNREKPQYAKLFQLDETRGFAAIAAGEACVQQCIQRGPFGLPVIPAGRQDKNPELGADVASVLRRVLQDVESQYDLVLVDAPAFLDDPDAVTVCTVIPRLVLVVRAGHLSFEVLQRIRQEIEQAVDGFTLVGAILNRHRRYIPGWIEEWLLK
jgi:Mrp family chromosome partitioning ATPase